VYALIVSAAYTLGGIVNGRAVMMAAVLLGSVVWAPSPKSMSRTPATTSAPDVRAWPLTLEGRINPREIAVVDATRVVPPVPMSGPRRFLVTRELLVSATAASPPAKLSGGAR
jgi:hypothetical protein